MAEHLNRSVAPINRFISENNVFSNSEEAKDYETLKQKLHGKSFWNEVTNQFDETSGELEYFESTWINLMKQFREDVLAAEELQIKQFFYSRILKLSVDPRSQIHPDHRSKTGGKPGAWKTELTDKERLKFAELLTDLHDE